MHPLLWLSAGGILLTVGDIIFKYWLNSYSKILFALGISTYLIGLLFLVQSFKRENIAVATVIFVLINVVTLLLASWYLFDEPLSIYKISAIALALVAVAMLELAP